MPNKTTENGWFAYAKPRAAARLRLFCLPYAGGSALIYRTWADWLPSDIEVFPIQLPGRGTRMKEKPFTSINPLVDAIEHAISRYLDKPFALFGHSMGATISFELARKLRLAGGLQPVHLFISGRRAPQLPNPDPPSFNLPHQEFIEELRRLEGTPSEVLDNPEFLELLLPTLRADFELVDTYKYIPASPLTCPITALGGITDKEVSREQVEAWREQSSGPFRLHMLPGNHFFLHQQERLVVQVITQALQNWPHAGDASDRS